MTQEIVNIEISKLHLWTENPRDPFDFNMSDDAIILRAMTQAKDKWDLEKLINQMGSYYDISELPTVVLEENKYIVYDGNRRLAIIKYAQNPQWSSKIENRLFPTNSPPESFREMGEIPCNLCDKDTALTNIERKHINSGSWGELERSHFLNIHRGEPKDNLLIIEEHTGGIISNNKNMNQRFVREEILTDENLTKIGFKIKGEKLLTNYDKDQTKLILDRIVELMNQKKISTRKNRGKLLEPLMDNYSDLQLEEYSKEKTNNIAEDNNTVQKRRTQITITNNPEIFGGKLTLKKGDTNNIYRDIETLYEFYSNKRTTLSPTFPSLIRMALRLLVESATDDKKITGYIKRYFDKAKKTLNQDQTTTLTTQSVDGTTIIKFLHIGAHDYSASNNIDQTLAMSLIIGSMLSLSHSKK